MSAKHLGSLGPAQHDGRLMLECEKLHLELDPRRGGRITSLRLGAQELLAGPEVHPTNWGSTYWTSPQEDWRWPPPAALDDEPYTVSVEGAGISLTSGPAFAGEKHFRLTKRLTPRLGRQAIAIEYVLENLGEEPYAIASWEISRVSGGGLSFFEAGAREYTLVSPHTVLPTTKRGTITWFDHRDFVAGEGAKLNADSRAGWVAHVVRGARPAPDVLFLKVFVTVPLERQAPGEGVVELYADELGGYVEVENQGPYDRIEPRGTSTYRVTWLVRELPASVPAEVGSADLLGLVRSLVEQSTDVEEP